MRRKSCGARSNAKPNRKIRHAFKPSKLERARGTQRYAQFSLDLLDFKFVSRRCFLSSGKNVASSSMFLTCDASSSPCSLEILFWKKEKDGVSLLDLLLVNALKCARLRGHSSVGRAVALQAIGQGFESPCLHA